MIADWKIRASSEAGFSEVFPTLPMGVLRGMADDAPAGLTLSSVRRGRFRGLEDFACALSPQAGVHLEDLATLSQRMTLRHFGRTIRLFAPIYLSNECINICKYCGFSRDNPIPRLTIPISQALEEVSKLARQGFRSLLIVAGEHPKYVSNGYVEEVIRGCLRHMPSIAIELGPMETEGYGPLVRAGCEGLVVYQETYHEPTYRELHSAGPKKHYAWRMGTPERGYRAGFRRLGIGALFGLHDWKYEAIAVAAHALHLLRTCWKAQITISLPRMRPATGGFQPNPAHCMSDREMVRLIAAFRILLPHCGIVLSTRESPSLRDGLVPLGITHMSAGSATEPGAYSHFDESQWTSSQDQPGEQFHIADERPPATVAAMIRGHGYEPVWKDFDPVLATTSYQS